MGFKHEGLQWQGDEVIEDENHRHEIPEHRNLTDSDESCSLERRLQSAKMAEGQTHPFGFNMNFLSRKATASANKIKEPGSGTSHGTEPLQSLLSPHEEKIDCKIHCLEALTDSYKALRQTLWSESEFLDPCLFIQDISRT